MPPKMSSGPTFTTNFASGGGTSESRIFSAGGVNVVNEERRLIDKVFGIVDKDNSGAIDIEELKQMFNIFGVDTNYLTTAIQRIMTNVDRDHDGTISPNEFYQLLSQKFEAKDVREKPDEVQQVFRKMSENNQNGQLTAESLHKVAQMLGEDMPKGEIYEMIKMFNREYQTKVTAANAKAQKDAQAATQSGGKAPPPEDIPLPNAISYEDFIEVMKKELGDEGQNQSRAKVAAAGDPQMF